MNYEEKVIYKFIDLNEEKINIIILFLIMSKELKKYPGNNLFEKLQNTNINKNMCEIFMLCVCFEESKKKGNNDIETVKINNLLKERWDKFINYITTEF
jgi:hypothetical protein